MKSGVLLLALLLVGCGAKTRDYFPLQLGNKWTYEVTIDNDVEIIDLTVAEEAPVGDHQGYLLQSEMGDSRLAWDGDTLLAAELAGTRYSPPIPLYAPDGTDWSGVVQAESKQVAGKATVSRSEEELVVGGRSFQTVKCVLTLDSGEDHIQLTTWFYAGMGILRQEQRSGPALERDRNIVFVSGP